MGFPELYPNLKRKQMTANNDIEMSKYLKRCHRAFHILILGLIGLTFVAYYRTSINEIRPFLAERLIGNGTVMVDMPNDLLRSTAEGKTALNHLSGNLSSETSGHWIDFQSASDDSKSPVGSQSGVSSQILSSSENLQTTGSNGMAGVQRIVKMVESRNTTRQIYHMGHDVTVPDKCPNNGTEVKLVIIIASAPSHTEARTAIRQTWGHFGQRRDVAILFMLGKTQNAKLEETLKLEENLYGDVVRGRYYDSYSNLTLKTISSLEWVRNYCNEAKFMLKTDDDMFINVLRLLSFIDKHTKEKNVIFGRLAKEWKPIRNKKSKYYVSLSQYKSPVFPEFTTGPAYLLSSDVIEKLFLTALDQTYLRLEDVFITGVVAEKLSVRRSHANEFLNTRISHSPCNVQRAISIHMVKYQEQFDMWKKLLDGTSKC